MKIPQRDGLSLSVKVFLFILLLFLLLYTTVGLNSSCIAHKKTPESPTQCWAVIVGVGEYEYLDVNTQYADDDARDLYQQLEPFFGNDHIKLLVDADATKNNLKSAIYDWLDPREDENDVVMIFLAGHGNSEYIQLYDSLRGSYSSDTHFSEFADWLHSLESKNVAIIMDVCGSGSFAEGVTNSGYVLLTCGTGCEICWQDDTYGHGVFSYYLIQAFANLHSVDKNNDNNISAEEIFAFVNALVTEEFQLYPPLSIQHPMIIDNHDSELVLFTIEDIP